jgi:putative peptidoglycan lipid II flippase
MGFLREIVIARQAGANAATDVYFTAFTIPDFVNYLLAGGALSITFIPIFSSYLAEGREEEGWRVFSIVTTFLAVALGVGIVLAMVFAPELAPLVANGFDAGQQAQLVRFTRIVLPAQFFHFQGFLLSAVQMARGQHKYPALSPLIYNGGTILGGLLLGPSLGMEGFCWGVLGGAFAGSFLLQLYGARKVGLRWWPTLQLKHPGFLKYIRLSLPIMVGQSLVVWDEWLTRYFGSYLTAASISWLNYGRKLAMVPQAVFGQAAGTASYPTMARQAAEGQVQAVFDGLTRALRSVLVMALGTQVFLMVLAPEICYVLFHSSRFDLHDVHNTAVTLTLFSLGIAAWSVQGIVARGYYAFKDTMTPTVLGTGMTILSVPLYAVMSRMLAHTGLALASTVAITAYAVVLYLGFERKVRRQDPAASIPSIVPFLARVAGACAVAAGVSYAVRLGMLELTAEGAGLTGWLESRVAGWASAGGAASAAVAWIMAVLRALVVAAVGGPVLVAACLVLGVEEIRELVQKIARRLLGARRAERLMARWG